MKTFLFTLCVCFASHAFGQQKEKCCTSEPLTPITSAAVSDLPQVENYDGSFQFRIDQGDSFSFTYALLEYIESNRKDDEDVVLDLGNGRSVLIVSDNYRQSSEFVPFDSMYEFNQ